MHKPEKGWDPVPSAYAKKYAEVNYASLSHALIADVVAFTGDLNGQHVLDLGAGPGQYSIEFSKLGAVVTWHDISRNYLNIAKEKSAEQNVVIAHYKLDYMDNASGQYDLIFNRVCWFYCISDRRFAETLLGCLRENGKMYLVVHNEDFRGSDYNDIPTLTKWRSQFFAAVNNYTGIKIGHPHMSKARIEKLFRGLKAKSVEISHDLEGSTTIKICK
jgi:SAM-dependent methyltransferase